MVWTTQERLATPNNVGYNPADDMLNDYIPGGMQTVNHLPQVGCCAGCFIAMELMNTYACWSFVADAINANGNALDEGINVPVHGNGDYYDDAVHAPECADALHQWNGKCAPCS